MDNNAIQEPKCPHCRKILDSMKMPPSGKGMIGVVYEIERYHLSGECAAVASQLPPDTPDK
jgi:hypothetical protein